MAKKVIDVGMAYGDVVEPIRDGFGKCNDNFTELYNSNVSGFRFKKLSGITHASEGGVVNISHGLDFTKIISFNAVVHSANLHAMHSYLADSKFEVNALQNYFQVYNMPDDSALLLSKPFDIFIVYVD